MRPVVDGLEQAYAGRLTVVKLNFTADADTALVRALRVRGHPTTIILDGDRSETHRFLGPATAETLEAAILANLK